MMYLPTLFTCFCSNTEYIAHRWCGENILTNCTRYLMSQYIWIPLQEILLQRHSFSYRSWKIELLSNREIPFFFFYTFPANKNSPNFFSPYRRNTHMILNRLNHPHTKHLYAMNPEIFTKFARQSKFHYRPL